MNHKFYFDIAAFIVLLVIIEFYLRRNRERSTKNRLFLLLALLSVSTTVVSLADSVMAFYGYPNLEHMYFIKMAAAVLFDLVAPVYVFYLLFAANLQHRLRGYKTLILCAWVPLGMAILSVVILCGVLVASPDAENIMGQVFAYYNIQCLIVGLLYAVIGVVFCIKFRDIIIEQKNEVTLLPIIVLSITISFAYRNPEDYSIVFVAAFCFLILILFGRSAEGTIDMETGFKTIAEFDHVIKMDSMVEKQSNIVVIVIKNYRDILHRNGYDVVKDIIVELADQIKVTLDKNKVPAYSGFYDGNGSFFVQTPRHSEKATVSFAEDMGRFTMSMGNIGETDQTVVANICSIRFPEDAEEFDTILMIADDVRDMPHRLRVLSASEFTDTEEFEIRKQMVMIIDRAITNGYLEVYYQPIYNVKLDKFVSAEALIRLKDPEYGFVSPGVFIPLAEKTGTIHKIGSFVIEEVCKFIGSEEFKGLGVEYIEINLSAAQCLRADLLDEIKHFTEKYGVNSSQLNMEITETAACYSQERLLNNIRSIHAEGYTFSLDDFGTGYSNLLRMALLPIDIVKMDKTFVNMDDDGKFHLLIKDMIKLFKRMGLKILVEGIETEDMANKFIENDVDYIQGYFYSKPLPKADYVGFVKNHNNGS